MRESPPGPRRRNSGARPPRRVAAVAWRCWALPVVPGFLPHPAFDGGPTRTPPRCPGRGSPAWPGSRTRRTRWGQESSRLPSISTAKVPARRLRLVPVEASERTALRKASKAMESRVSRGSISRVRASGEWRVQNRGEALFALMSRFSRRTTTSSTRRRMAGPISLVRVKRTGSQHLQQAGEGAGVAVVRRGGEKQPVLEPGRHQPQHLAEAAVFAEGGGHQVVALVDDQQVPGQMGEPSGVRQEDRNCSSTRVGAGSDRRRRSG